MEKSRSTIAVELMVASALIAGIGGVAVESASADQIDHIARNIPGKVFHAEEFSNDALVSPFPYNALSYNTPGLQAEASNDASASVQEQCIQAGLQMPQILSARMYRHGHANQTITVKGHYEPVNILANTECDDEIDRSAEIKYQLEVDGKYRTMTFPKWLLYYGGNQGGTAAPSQTPSGHEGSWIFYRCTPGAGKTHARAFIKQLVEAPSGAILGQKVKKVNLQVPGAC